MKIRMFSYKKHNFLLLNNISLSVMKSDKFVHLYQVSYVNYILLCTLFLRRSIEKLFGRRVDTEQYCIYFAGDKKHAILYSMQRTGKNIILKIVIKHAKFYGSKMLMVRISFGRSDLSEYSSLYLYCSHSTK